MWPSHDCQGCHRARAGAFHLSLFLLPRPLPLGSPSGLRVTYYQGLRASERGRRNPLMKRSPCVLYLWSQPPTTSVRFPHTHCAEGFFLPSSSSSFVFIGGLQTPLWCITAYILLFELYLVWSFNNIPMNTKL